MDDAESGLVEPLDRHSSISLPMPGTNGVVQGFVEQLPKVNGIG